MFVEPECENDGQLKELRSKQSQCCHPSYVCTLCRLHKDNLENHYKLIIHYLMKKIEAYEQKLDQIDPVYFHICEAKIGDIIVNIDNVDIDGKLIDELLS